MREPRILLIRPDHLGDVLLTLPAATALKRSVPVAHLTYLVASGLEPVPDRCPAVDETISLPFPPPTSSVEPSRWELVDSAAPKLRGRFDMAILLRPGDPWSGSLVRAAGIPVRIGFNGNGLVRFLTDTVTELRGRHAVLLAQDLVAAALRRLDGAVPADVPPPDVGAASPVFVPSNADHAEADETIERLKAVTGTRPLIVHPGTGWQLKNWSAERWGRLAFHLRRRFGVTPIVTGGSGERDLVEGVVAYSAGSGVGLTALSLGGFGALLSKAALVVASDSGPLHLAAMLGTPVVGLYGPGDPALAAPWCPPKKRRIVRIDLPCSPCGVMHDPPCGAVLDPACVTGVSVESVLEAAESLTAGVP